MVGPRLKGTGDGHLICPGKLHSLPEGQCPLSCRAHESQDLRKPYVRVILYSGTIDMASCSLKGAMCLIVGVLPSAGFERLELEAINLCWQLPQDYLSCFHHRSQLVFHEHELYTSFHDRIGSLIHFSPGSAAQQSCQQPGKLYVSLNLQAADVS